MASLGVIDSRYLYVLLSVFNNFAKSFRSAAFEMASEGLRFTFIGNKRTFKSYLCCPVVNWLKANIPIYHTSQFNECKLRNQGMDLCKQYNAQHPLTIVTSIPSIFPFVKRETLKQSFYKFPSLFFKFVILTCIITVDPGI